MDNLSDRITKANTLLTPYAILHTSSLGRKFAEEDDKTRSPFQRDRDRIIHTQAFRRLQGKTQVFVSGTGDHFRTRLTHTMEVAQISRDMARALGLNEDLAECIALAHDLGHTPFGHAGEEIMREIMEEYGSTFEHNLQSLRVVTILEERTKQYQGLNLNAEVLEGLMKHRTAYDEEHGHHIPRSPSLEAQIVNMADEIAYTAHDTDDGLRSGIIEHEDLLRIPLYKEAHDQSHARGTEVRGSLIHLLVNDAYRESSELLQKHNIQQLDDVYACKVQLISFSENLQRELQTLRSFLYENFYNAPEVLFSTTEGRKSIKTLFEAYIKLPNTKILTLQKRHNCSLHEAVKDYIAGMTDHFATAAATEIGGKKNSGSTG